MTFSPAAGLIAALVITLDAIRAILAGSGHGTGLVALAAIAAIGAALNARAGRDGRTHPDERI